MNQTCLVVDDSAVIRKVIRRIVENFNFQVQEAENGLAAYESCMKQMPELVILDWNMPVMSGLEFLIKLRQTQGGDSPQVVMCTTESEFPKIEEAITNGANEYIMKPFTAEILKEKLEILGLVA